MDYIDVGQPCLARNSYGLNRGILVDVSIDADSTKMTVFFVDTGLMVCCDIDDVYDIPIEFIDWMPYQAIRCSMFGIRSMSNGYDADVSLSPEWTSSVIDDIYDRIAEAASSSLYAYVLSKSAVESETTHAMDKMCHNVILLDYDWVNINESVARLKLAEFEEDVLLAFDEMEQKLKQLSNELEEDWDNEISEENNIQNTRKKAPEQTVDYEIDYDEIENSVTNKNANEFLEAVCEMFGYKREMTDPKGIGANQPAVTEGDQQQSAHQAELDEITEELEQEEDDDNKMDEDVKPTELILMRPLYKRPPIVWRQTEESLVLKIGVSENCKYDLEVQPTYLIFM